MNLTESKNPPKLAKLYFGGRMNRYTKDAVLIFGLAAFWFGGVYFAVAALFPAFALQVALIAMIFALVGYLFLQATNSHERGLPVALLFLFPIICITAGIAWWILRLLGVGPLTR